MPKNNFPFSYIKTPPPKIKSGGNVFSTKPKKSFDELTKMVIDNLEGGYFSREMLNDGRVKDPKGLFSKGEGRVDSGETLFGIDRLNGYSLRKNDKESWDNFWNTLDNLEARKNWSYNYMGGKDKDRLIYLAGKIMEKQHEKNSNTYLSPETKKIVDNDNGLLYHMIYANWNGTGWFKKFSNDLNIAVSKGVTNPKDLRQIAIHSRVGEGIKKGSKPNPLIKQTGLKIEKTLQTI